MRLADHDWTTCKELHHQVLGLPAQAMRFLEPILAGASVGLTAVAEAAGRGQIEICADKLLHYRRSTRWTKRWSRARPGRVRVHGVPASPPWCPGRSPHIDLK